jgi:hypothetical protein
VTLMGDVVVLPGVERRDLTGEEWPAERILRTAYDLGISDVVVIGRHRGGARYIASTFNDMDKVVGVLMDSVTFLNTTEFAQGISGEPDESEDPA